MESAEAVEPVYAVVDASVAVALCAKESGRHEIVREVLNTLALIGCQLYAPGIFVGECLFAMCRKRAEGRLDSVSYNLAIQTLDILALQISQFPHGDAVLTQRATRLLAGYGCSHSNDSLYLALAEALNKIHPTEVLTFDSGLKKQAAVGCPGLNVRLLSP